MSALILVGGVIVAGLFGYLLVALIKPELFP
ncbi:K(+)-transporting ATPase subunit F [Asticcacaulis sp. EMRT-3]|nr:K(+)-transporting ATPase subunit F [Asticcacaulis sp. EMRT-3]MDI7776009.1 K(+)-transporting ATPase subunit F [Asticcacaulis sp. EMRT-3]